MTIVRRAGVADAAVLGRLLWEFNTEFDSETDDAEVLGARFGRLLVLPEILAVLAEDGAGEAVGFALVSLRPAIWFDGPVSQLEELYQCQERPVCAQRGLEEPALGVFQGALARTK
jgi:hypothetical protein